jgi:NitT/TauT family transport system permease protein
MEGDLMRQLGRFTPFFLGVLSFIIILSVWEFSVWVGLADPFFVSSPRAIAGALVEQTVSGKLLEDLRVSLVEYAAGYGLGVVVGVLFGLLIGWYKVVDYALDPFVWFLYSAPLIGFYPVFVIILGLGKPTVIVITFKLAVVLILVNTAAGIKNVDPTLLQVARSFGARRIDLFFKVALPASVPMIIAGLRLGVGRALMGVVVAEMFGATAGLGASISYYGGLLKTTNMLAYLVVISSLGVLLTQILRVIEGHFESWRTVPEK